LLSYTSQGPPNESTIISDETAQALAGHGQRKDQRRDADDACVSKAMDICSGGYATPDMKEAAVDVSRCQKERA